MMTNDVSCFALYCDDIRTEAQNKHSLMGVYHRAIYLDTLPALLARFCVQVLISAPATRKIERCFLTLDFNGELVQTEELVAAELEEQRQFALDTGVATYSYMIRFHVSPLAVHGPGIFRTTVKADDDIIEAPSLLVYSIDDMPPNGQS